MPHRNLTPSPRPWVLPLSLLLLVLTRLPLTAAELAPGLVLVPPENVSMDVQPLEAVGGSPVLVGYVGGEPAYFVAAEAVRAEVTADALWTKLEAAVRDASDRSAFRWIDEGRFETHQGLPVHYRLYHYIKGGQEQTQAFYLIKSQRGYYWLYVTASHGVDLKALSPLVIAVLRRVEITPL